MDRCSLVLCVTVSLRLFFMNFTSIGQALVVHLIRSPRKPSLLLYCMFRLVPGWWMGNFRGWESLENVVFPGKGLSSFQKQSRLNLDVHQENCRSKIVHPVLLYKFPSCVPIAGLPSELQNLI